MISSYFEHNERISVEKKDNCIRNLSLKKGLSIKLYWTDILWAFMIAAFSAICFELFYRMFVNYNDNYPSDMRY